VALNNWTSTGKMNKQPRTQKNGGKDKRLGVSSVQWYRNHLACMTPSWGLVPSTGEANKQISHFTLKFTQVRHWLFTPVTLATRDRGIEG
jgi:hypothetical protein